MGDPIVDISAEMDEGVITKYGLEYGQTVFEGGVEWRPRGHHPARSG